MSGLRQQVNRITVILSISTILNPVKTNVVNVLDVAQAVVAEKTADADKTVLNHDPAIKGSEDLKVDKIRSAEDCRSLDLLAPTKSFFS